METNRPQPAASQTTTNSHGPETPLDPDRLPNTEGRYTPEQEREMGVTDSKGRTIQPTNAFLMVFLGYTGVAAVLIVIAIIIMKMMS